MLLFHIYSAFSVSSCHFIWCTFPPSYFFTPTREIEGEMGKVYFHLTMHFFKAAISYLYFYEMNLLYEMNIGYIANREVHGFIMNYISTSISLVGVNN